MTGIPSQAAEYRTRREMLNQIRRAIKSDIEGVFQSDQLRPNPISVQSEARRLMQRYSVIFRVFPFQQKFIKHLGKFHAQMCLTRHCSQGSLLSLPCLYSLQE